MAKEFAKKFYRSKSWSVCREVIYQKYFGLCGECGAIGEEVHHKIFLTAENINNADIALGEDNLILLCKNCHFEKHRKTNPNNFVKKKQLTNNSLYFNDQGELQEIQRYIIYGSPGCGKTTYVKNHKQYGDLVVDLDMLKQAISLEDKGEAPDNLLNVAKTMRESIYKLIEETKVDSKNIWIVAALPYKGEREALMKRLNAKLIFIDKDIQTCINNIENDLERKDKIFQRKIINKWFESYEK